VKFRIHIYFSTRFLFSRFKALLGRKSVHVTREVRGLQKEAVSKYCDIFASYLLLLSCSDYSTSLKMETTFSFETSVGF
jgi:hypothetical protein